MPSPFPGMDPFLESQRFDEFHSVYLVTLAELLVPLVRPAYTVDVERDVSRAAGDANRSAFIRESPIADATGASWGHRRENAMSTIEAEDEEQTFLTIRSRDDKRVVTVIELLSPSNKDGSIGTGEYLAKRANYLKTLTNLVEIDLLRGGVRLPTRPETPCSDYSALVIRQGDRGHAENYTWSLQDSLPVIPVPLADSDPDVGLNLQLAFETTYDRRGYDYVLNYADPLRPTLSQELAAWVAQRLQTPRN